MNGQCVFLAFTLLSCHRDCFHIGTVSSILYGTHKFDLAFVWCAIQFSIELSLASTFFGVQIRLFFFSSSFSIKSPKIWSIKRLIDSNFISGDQKFRQFWHVSFQFSLNILKYSNHDFYAPFHVETQWICPTMWNSFWNRQ